MSPFRSKEHSLAPHSTNADDTILGLLGMSAVKDFLVVKWVAALVVTIVTATPTSVWAQDTTVHPYEGLRVMLGELVGTVPLQLITPGVILDDIQLVSIQESTVELTQLATGNTITVDLSAIRNVAVERSHWMKTTLWGISGGVLAGSVFGLMIGSFKCTDINECKSDERAGAARWGATLGFVGGAVGFTAGRKSKHWRTIYP